MRRVALAFAGLLFCALWLSAQTEAPPRYLVDEELFQAIASEFSGARAKENVKGITQFHRIQASPGFTRAREWVVGRLNELGITDVEVEIFRSDGEIRYQTYTSPLAWTVREGELWIEEPFQERFCRYTEVPMCLTTLSNGGEWSGEVVAVGRGTEDADYEGKDVRGKVVLATGYAAQVHRQAVIKRGALGVLIYPAASDRPEHPHMVRYNGLWLKAEEAEQAGFGFQLSRRQGERLLAALASGQRVRIRAKVDAELHPGQLEITSAFFRPSAALRASGEEFPEQEIILISHLDHPKWSANDNASGSGALIEVARTLRALIEEKKVRLRRTIRLMWVPEHMGTIAWVDKHPDIGDRAIAVLNLDMVGEDLYQTNSRLRITRTPESLPSFLNDLVENVAEQVAAANLSDPAGSQNLFHYTMTSYEPGSDHDIFNDGTIGVPAVMFYHWPDWTHHTSEDTPDKVDPTTLKRVGVVATATAVWLATAGEEEGEQLATLGFSNAVGKLYQSNLLLLMPTIVMEMTEEEVGHLRDSFWRSPTGRRARHLAWMGLEGFAIVERIAPWLAESMKEPIDPFDRVTGFLEYASTVVPIERRGPVPRRLFLGPLADSYASPWFREQLGADYAWWEEQAEKIPHWGVLVYETLNFTDGKRSLAEIEEAVAAEFGEVPEGVVERLLRDLEKVGLVELIPPRAD